ncbi:hypothetical protein LTR37_009925 [Vermiconidia calcicola]|uniref:Uncharacterized protein n=1 Tax=Vermiconidia calcicola TaxID=1690605 RepID=A0ACC3N6W1_9PEZI|nr:hypothetical protein LTR37_009925 [Vermiconidia calcicola]
MVFFTFASVWCGLASSFDSLLAARAVQGMAGAVYTVAPTVIAEVFFLHERGRAMAIYTAFLAGGPYVGGISGSYIASSLGYQYIFWISTAFAVWSLLMQYLLVPETLFDREQQVLGDSTPLGGEDGITQEKSQISTVERAAGSEVPARYTYIQSLGFGRYRGDWLSHFLAPWLSLRLPGTWVVVLQYGALVGGVVSTATIGPMFLAAPPYLWHSNVGLFNLGGLVGVAIGALFTFLTADYMIKWRAKKEQHGFSEPETRLPVLIPGIFLGTIGLWTFGFCAANPSAHGWAGLVVGSGMHAAGLTMVPSIGFNYLIEAYGALSGDCFTMTSVARSVVGFAWTYFTAEWIMSAGPALPFGIFGMLTTVFGLLALPLYFFGKRSRIATAGFVSERHGF